MFIRCAIKFICVLICVSLSPSDHPLSFLYFYKIKIENTTAIPYKADHTLTPPCSSLRLRPREAQHEVQRPLLDPRLGAEGRDPHRHRV